MRCWRSVVQIFQRAHIVQAVGELDHHHAHIVHHGQQHLADVFGLARFGREQIEAADFGGAFHQPRHVGAKLLGDGFERNFRVFDDVVQQRGAQRGHIELHVREDVRYFDRMRKERLAGKARLRFVLLGGEIVGAAQQLEIVAGTVAAHLVRSARQSANPQCGGQLARWRVYQPGPYTIIF